ncbi:hypothetical protein F3Y22_tig00000778pilonHSYRG00015 [Hibiscus syriacus]|uniref:Pentatricopeptide repeat-containing protein n=1 Tax=Hibiscus syriacus TaxID=106335 RepID=A0A6A3D3U1_HIBSY|nr:hypothetical protein F3Y22_tig00000778pilonHSYRG00015 [Hibiscus syriacus]
MAFLSVSKRYHVNLKHRAYPRISIPLHFFTTTQDLNNAPPQQQEQVAATRRTPRVPEFDHSLVYNVLHGAKNSEHALQFFRWVERACLIRHDREAHMKIIQILGRASKLNHARCILLDMPKKGVEWDEDFFVVLIDSYGKAGILKEAVKIFQKMEDLGVNRTIKS